MTFTVKERTEGTKRLYDHLARELEEPSGISLNASPEAKLVAWPALGSSSISIGELFGQVKINVPDASGETFGGAYGDGLIRLDDQLKLLFSGPPLFDVPIQPGNPVLAPSPLVENARKALGKNANARQIVQHILDQGAKDPAARQRAAQLSKPVVFSKA